MLRFSFFLELGDNFTGGLGFRHKPPNIIKGDADSDGDEIERPQSFNQKIQRQKKDFVGGYNGGNKAVVISSSGNKPDSDDSMNEDDINKLIDKVHNYKIDSEDECDEDSNQKINNAFSLKQKVEERKVVRPVPVLAIGGSGDEVNRQIGMSNYEAKPEYEDTENDEENSGKKGERERVLVAGNVTDRNGESNKDTMLLDLIMQTNKVDFWLDF